MVPSATKGLSTQILDEIQEMSSEEEAIIIATVKCVAHTVAVLWSEPVAPAGVLDCSTEVSMDVARTPLLLPPKGACEPAEE